jgi:hypothetical protein
MEKVAVIREDVTPELDDELRKKRKVASTREDQLDNECPRAQLAAVVADHFDSVSENKI